MACPRVSFTIQRAGRTVQQALETCINESLLTAVQLCRDVDVQEQCPFVANILPAEVEFLDARRAGPNWTVRAKMTYQCRGPGQGCLFSLFGGLLGGSPPEMPAPGKPLEELLADLEPGPEAESNEV